MLHACYEAVLPLQEQRMDPEPDYGYDSYKGTGKLKGKVRVATATTCICTFTSAEGMLMVYQKSRSKFQSM